jgi:hypothetical protein
MWHIKYITYYQKIFLESLRKSELHQKSPDGTLSNFPFRVRIKYKLLDNQLC